MAEIYPIKKLFSFAFHRGIFVLNLVLFSQIGWGTNYTCGTATALTLNVTGTGTCYGSDASPQTCSSGGYLTPTHQWYNFTTTVAGTYTLTMTPTGNATNGTSGLDAVMQLLSGACNGTNMQCQDNNGTGVAETFTVVLSATTTYLIHCTSYSQITSGSSYGTFNILVNAPPSCSNPTITTQPSTTVQNICLNGTSTAFSIAATGTTLTYQWYSNTANSNSGGTLISGATGTSYTPTTSSIGTTYYYCIVKSAGSCPVTSNVSGAVIINPLPSINLGAAPAICKGNTAASLSYSSPTNSPNQYSIVYDATALGQGFANVTNAALPASPIGLTVPAGANAGTYNGTITVTNSTTGCTSSSTSFNVIVNAAPSISVQPSTTGQSVCQNASVTAYSITSSGAGLTYQWYSNTINSNSGGSLISGATSSSYTPSTVATGTLYYYCIVSGTCTSPAVSNVSGAVTVNASPTVAAIGGGAASVCVGGTTPAFTDATSGGTWSITNGTGSASIAGTGIATGVSAGSATVNYAVTSAGCTTTQTTGLTVSAQPSITTQPSNQTLCASTNAVFTIAATNSPSYQWQSSANNSTWANVANGTPTGYTYSGSTSTSLTVSGTGSVVYYFRCLVTGAGCSNIISNSVSAASPPGGAYSVSWPMTSGNLNPTVTGNVTASAVSCAGASNFGYYSDCSVTGYAADTWDADTHCSSTTFLWGGGSESDYFQVSITPITCATINVTNFTAQINDGFSSCSPHQNFGKVGYSTDGGTTFQGIHTPGGSNCCYCFSTNGNGSWNSIVTSSINLKSNNPIDIPVIASVTYPSSIIFRIFMDQNNGGNNSIRNYIKGIAASGTVTTPLPINIISFTGENSKNGVQLNWQTATELNNDYFTIERSLDGKEWNAIGKVKGAGNSSAALSYEFLDSELPTGVETIYYRLKQTDYDGKFEYFGPVSVKLSPANEWGLILKNPAEEELKGTLFATEDANVMIDILDLQGRIIKSEKLSAMKGSNLLQIDLGTLVQGVYFIKAYNRDKNILSKFVKM